MILSFTGMHTLWSSHKYDTFYNLHQQHKVFSRLSDWMWYLFYDIFQNSFFMENHLAEHVHIFWNYICIMEWTDSLQEALIENQDRELRYMFLISLNCSKELLICSISAWLPRNSIFTKLYNGNIKSFSTVYVCLNLWQL